METYLNQSHLEELGMEEMMLVDGGGFLKDLWSGFKLGIGIGILMLMVLA